MIGIDTLLSPTLEDAPCGKNLEHDPAFQALELAARGKPEQQSMGRGDSLGTIAAVAPNWQEVRRLARELLTRTKDLRVAIYLLRADVRVDDLSACAAGLDLLYGLLDHYWDAVYPRPDPDDGELIERLNALAALTDSEGLLLDLRSALITPPTKLGRIALRDLLASLGKAPPVPGTPVRPLAEVEAALVKAASEHPESLGRCRLLLPAVERIQVLLSERLKNKDVLDLSPLISLLRPLAEVLDRVTSNGSDPHSAATPAQPDAAGASGQQAVGGIRSREDALRLLDRVCEFIERTEPSNPAPLLIRRAQRLMSKNFIEILQDLVPDGVEKFRSVAGLKEDSR